MASNVIMPALGVAQQTATLLRWLIAEGKPVNQGDPLMEIETDKATVEIEAVASGVLARVMAKPGDEVPVGQTVALILAPGENLPTKPPVAQDAPGVPTRPLKKGRQLGRATTTKTLPTGLGGTRALASPKAKRIAKEQGIELKSLHGSGPEGSILAVDVLRAADEKRTRSAASETPELFALTPMRRRIGERMAQSKQSTPHFYVSMEVDMSAVNQLRSAWKEQSDTAIPSINDFILHASARALKDYPSMNSSFTERGILRHKDINIGLAVELEEGLVVPVIRNADRLSLMELARQSHELADKAKNKRILPADYQGATFTVSNLGMLGVESFIGIIDPPQAAILAVGRVGPRVVTDGEGIEIRTMMTANLSADHRVVDGASAARFLQRLKQYLETQEGAQQ